MIFGTPTQKGSFLAGISLWILPGLGSFKADEVVVNTALRHRISKDHCVRWISGRRSTALLGTELFNYRTHGIAQPEGVVFAAGGTIVNALVTWVGASMAAMLHELSQQESQVAFVQRNY